MSDRTLALAYCMEHEWAVVEDLSIRDRTDYVVSIADTLLFVAWKLAWEVLPWVPLRPAFYIGDLTMSGDPTAL